VASLLAATVA
jgi:hypothetical protein